MADFLWGLAMPFGQKRVMTVGKNIKTWGTLFRESILGHTWNASPYEILNTPLLMIIIIYTYIITVMIRIEAADAWCIDSKNYNLKTNFISWCHDGKFRIKYIYIAGKQVASSSSGRIYISCSQTLYDYSAPFEFLWVHWVVGSRSTGHVDNFLKDLHTAVRGTIQIWFWGSY